MVEGRGKKEEKGEIKRAGFIILSQKFRIKAEECTTTVCNWRKTQLLLLMLSEWINEKLVFKGFYSLTSPLPKQIFLKRKEGVLFLKSCWTSHLSKDAYCLLFFFMINYKNWQRKFYVFKVYFLSLTKNIFYILLLKKSPEGRCYLLISYLECLVYYFMTNFCACF